MEVGAWTPQCHLSEEVWSESLKEEREEICMRVVLAFLKILNLQEPREPAENWKDSDCRMDGGVK